MDPPLEVGSLSRELHWLEVPEQAELLELRIAVMTHGCLS